MESALSMEPVAAPTPARESSPSPSTSPTPAIGACPPLERSISTASSATTLSGFSTSSRASQGAQARRRGYLRTQGGSFAESAKARESVMSLGSIAHLQYYFARTGLLDGKGAQLARSSQRRKAGAGQGLSLFAGSEQFLAPGSISSGRSSFSSSGSAPDPLVFEDISSLVESPIEDVSEDSWSEHQEPNMLPPTVSTYVHRTKFVPPPPTLDTLRRELQNCLDAGQKAIGEVLADQHKLDVSETPKLNSRPPRTSEEIDHSLDSESQDENTDPNLVLEEIQGMHILDVMTLAIRSAKIYYTAHENPKRLAAIKTERQIRQELLDVLEVLKRMALRTFSGGMRAEEADRLSQWIQSVHEMLRRERDLEEAEAVERQKWPWLVGDWDGREQEREWLFLKSFDDDPETFQAWTPATEKTSLPTPFLLSLQDGIRLVRLHNEAVGKSGRPFGRITSYHADTSLPYRCAENLLYWLKAAEIRWELKLDVDVTGVVHGSSNEAWQGFEDAVFNWARKVRTEITDAWKEKEQRKQRAKVDVPQFNVSTQADTTSI